MLMISSKISKPLIIFLSILLLGMSVELRSHHQITTFAQVLTNENHVDQQTITVPGQSSSTTPNSSSPKIAAGIIVPIICVGLCVLFCFFCLKCAKNEHEQAQRAVEETIPCYCGPCKLLCPEIQYLVCADVILRCLGIRRTNWEKKQQERLKEEEKMRQKQEKENRKKGVPQVHQSNPYSMQRQGMKPEDNHWFELPDQSQGKSVKKSTCLLCMNKTHSFHPNITTNCGQECTFHLECLIDFKKANQTNKQSLNSCPNCRSQYYNKVRFYCQKCWKRYNEILLESGNIYASQLDFSESLKSIGGEKCDQCRKKKWFWQ